MVALALLISAVGSIFVMCLKPVAGLAIYTIISMWFPYGIATVSVGTIDFSAGRIVILVLFAKILFNANLTARFKIIWVDKFILILFAAELIAGLTTVPAMQLIVYRAGDFFDMALPYFAVRLIITDRQKFITFLKSIAWSAGILSLFAFYESATGNNLLAFGRSFMSYEVRMFFFHRAQSTFRHPIYYGVFSAMTGAFCAGLMSNVKPSEKKIYLFLTALCFLGAFSSMSSGGLLAMVGALAFLVFYRYRYNWKQVCTVIIILCVLVEVVSNRHFYDVIDRFCFNSGSAWYRSRLIEVAFFEGGMSGHWLFGYGYEDPMWSTIIDNRDHTDMVNYYLLKLCRYGLVGFVPFCAVIISSLKSLFKNYWQISNKGDSWMLWCVATGIFGVLLSFNSVSLFGMPMTMLYIMFGVCGSAPKLVNNQLHRDVEFRR